MLDDWLAADCDPEITVLVIPALDGSTAAAPICPAAPMAAASAVLHRSPPVDAKDDSF